ncbi:glycosyl hydrolase family 8 [Cohnella rhizosphaerae]|uniref:Glycosyl hydrolase family 8 n=1 Tax=Cohnella rhizosphaerae TaxID=1457232 RepID=A0A9X4L1A7_9BACL|nr:glycosyl hydrolase family 8 [Cohnella rhizosphaerae]MDG0811674.1 glycosyl hydrolase family 8 [Cohnella rhizosphaerae]
MTLRLIAVLAACAAFLAGCAPRATTTEDDVARLLPATRYGASSSYDEGRAALERFIQNRLTGPDGVYTNLVDTAQNGASASGHEVLSESAGLSMRYYALSGEREAFESVWSRARAVFDMNASFSYRYSPLSGKRYPVNAAVDDLRIIRALYEAGDAFKAPAYTSEADEYGKRFYAYNVKEGRLYDFYDETYKTTNDFATLCYIDLKTLGLLKLPDDGKKRLLDHARRTVEGGYLGDAFPFLRDALRLRQG